MDVPEGLFQGDCHTTLRAKRARLGACPLPIPRIVFIDCPRLMVLKQTYYVADFGQIPANLIGLNGY
jgi:hypothetical protein